MVLSVQVFFDWLITPHAAVIDLISNRFEIDLSEGEIHRCVIDGTLGVVHRRLQVQFFHDYDLATDESYLRGIPRVSDKYKFLARRVCENINTSDITMIVSNGSSMAECEQINSAFAHAFPDKIFGILAAHELHNDADDNLREPEISGRIIRVGLLPAHGDHAWEGSPKEWDRAFQSADHLLLNSFALI